MLTSLTATNIDTAATITINDLTYPLRRFAWDYDIKGDAEPKMRKAGRHKTLKQIDTMTIEMEGSMMADISQNYWTIRKAFMAIFLPHPDAVELNHVKFEMVIAGSSDTLYAECTLADVSVPVEALSPTRSEFMFNWECPFGYWRDDSDDSAVMI